MKMTRYALFLLCVASLLFSSCTKEEILNNKVPIANAGDDLNVEISPEDILSLSGSGSDTDGEVVAYLWSQVSGPNDAKFINNGSAETRVGSLIPGVYVFQLMVIDDQGATGVDNVTVTVKWKTVTLSLRPANNPNEVHFLGGNGIDQAAPHALEFGAAAWTIGGVQMAIHGIFKFDLSSIPASATITSAKLSLYSNPIPLNGNLTTANAGTQNAMLIQRVTNSWSAAGLTWANQPATTTEHQVEIPHTDLPFLDLVDVDVTELVKQMTGSNENYGFGIRLKQETIYNSRIFCSSKNPDATKHPKLEAVYKFD